MGRSNGSEYRTLSEDDDDVVDLPSLNGVVSPFSAIPLDEEEYESGRGGVMAREQDEDDVSTGPDDAAAIYWADQKGISWLLSVVVKKLCTGNGWRAVVVLISFFLVGIGLFLAALLAYPITLETSLSSFQIPQHKVYIREDAFEAATGSALSTRNSQFQSRRRRSSESTFINYGGSSRYPANILSPSERSEERWKINLVYRTVDGSNILKHEHIERIHWVERQIEAHHRYTEFCWLNWNAGGLAGHPYPSPLSECFPLNSLMTYFYPKTGRSDQMALDGDVDAIVRNAWSSSDFFWYMDSSFSSSNPTSKLMRSQIILGYPLHDHSHRTYAQQHDAAKSYIVDLIPLLASLSNDKIQVLYGSPDIYDYQVLSAAYADVRLSIFSVVLIAVFVFVLTSFSPFLTFICLEAVAMSLPLAYVVYRVFAGISTFGLLNILSLFVITGIGVDDGFMFINTFRQAPSWARADITVRVHYTLHAAGKATLFTSATTAAAFFANMASGIPAVHNFGLFMGLVVVMCYLTVLVQMPVALFLWEKYPRMRATCVPNCNKGGDGRGRHARGDGVELMPVESGGGGGGSPANGTRPSNGHGLSASDGSTLEAREAAPPPKPANDCLTGHLSRFITRFIARPVVKYRAVVVVAFVILYSTSVGLVTRLRTADKPPQFFPSGSNLQQFVELGYNTSQMNIDCSKCSGYFHAGNLPSLPTPAPAPTFQPSFTTAPVPDLPTYGPPPPTTTTAPPVRTIIPTTTQEVVVTEIVATTRTRTTTPPAAPTLAPTLAPITSRQAPPPPVVNPSAPPVRPVTRPAPSAVTVVDKCKLDPASCVAAAKPSLVSTANVYIVFGIKTLIRNSKAAQHVITSGTDAKDTVVYDTAFANAFSSAAIDRAALSALCSICMAAIDPARGLVAQTAGAFECFPSKLRPYLPLLSGIPGCSDPRITKAGSAVHSVADVNGSNVNWLGMAFKSNVFKGGSSFTARLDYNKWDAFMDEVHRNFTIPAIQSAYQTSEFWKQIFLEVVAVTSALYSIGLSAMLCLIFVAIFTGCPLLTILTIGTVGGIASFVLGCFYLLGWHLGAVEAISMSILIGTAVDYCVHLVEGYLVARNHLKLSPIPKSLPFMVRVRTNIAQSCERALWSLSHIGLSIVSSALTTLFASLPLCFAQIQLLARFGQIMFINTLASIILTATACCALLCFQPQWKFPGTWRASIAGFVASGVFCGCLFLVLYIIHVTNDISIPAPDGSNLF